MESDFSIRKEVDGIDSGDPNLRELLNSYKFPPPNAQPTYTSQQPDLSGNSMYLGNIMGQLQGTVERLAREKQQERSLGGLQLNIDPEVLRWIVVLAVILIIVWLFLKGERTRKLRKKNPLKRRLRKLEKQVSYLSDKKGKSRPALDDYASDDEEDDLD